MIDQNEFVAIIKTWLEHTVVKQTVELPYHKTLVKFLTDSSLSHRFQADLELRGLLAKIEALEHESDKVDNDYGTRLAFKKAFTRILEIVETVQRRPHGDNMFALKLTHAVMQAMFTFGPKSPLASSKLVSGMLITSITCIMEDDAAIYDYTYMFNGSIHTDRAYLLTHNDEVLRYICNRFNVMIFGEKVVDMAFLDSSALTVDSVRCEEHQFNSEINYFRSEVERMSQEKAIN